MSGLTPPPWPSYQCRTAESQPTASRLLPPSPRRERGAGAASVSGCLSFWQSTLPRETARSLQHLSLAFRGCVLCLFAGLTGYLETKRGDSAFRARRRVLLDPTGGRRTQRPGDTKHGTVRQTASSAVSLACTFALYFTNFIEDEEAGEFVFGIGGKKIAFWQRFESTRLCCGASVRRSLAENRAEKCPCD